MPISKRGSTYHLRRRVPRRYESVEDRKIVYLSLKTDSMTEAQRRADDVWKEMIAHWEALLRSDTNLARDRWFAARELAQTVSLPFMTSDKIAKLPLADLMKRVEMSMNRDGEIDDRKARAFLGTIEDPGTSMTEALDSFFEITEEDVRAYSPNQLRVRNNNFKRAIGTFVKVVGDIPMHTLTDDHMMQLREFMGERARMGDISFATANKEMKMVGTVLRRVNKMRRMNLDLPLSGWGFKGAKDNVRKPFSTHWIQTKLLRGDALDGLNDEARGIVLLMVNTGLRPSEAAGLLPDDIHLGGAVPYVEIKARDTGAQMRAVKTSSAERVIPLAGVSLDAARANPRGFPRYYDKAGLSATVNKYLRERGLMETPAHSLYCLRHSFEDRMLEAGIDERVRRDFLGHALGRERYGEGGSLKFRHAQIRKVALG
ncbi:DUF6538 domain-containing protein [Citreimonas sp.]|uniref:DUF6538 domain-containing protein n=1 Tax=Citreimonas sp. TaxID=3036715 RepID=UPI00405A4B80